MCADTNEIPKGDRKKLTNATMTNNASIEHNEVITNNNGTSGRISAETIPEKSDNLTYYIILGCFCGVVAVILIVIFNSSFAHSYLGINKLRLSRDSEQ